MPRREIHGMIIDMGNVREIEFRVYAPFLIHISCGMSLLSDIPFLFTKNLLIAVSESDTFYMQRSVADRALLERK